MFYGRTFNTTRELETAIAEYIEFYNTRRIKVSLNGMSIADARMPAVASN
ncbi:IS3 family transposase [Corynebacterium sp.]